MSRDTYQNYYVNNEYKFYIWDMYEVDDEIARKNLKAIFSQLSNQDIRPLS